VIAARLVRSGVVLAPAEVARTRADRRRGLLGRDRVDGTLVLRPCRQVHTFGMRCPVDVLWCDRRGKVLRMATLPPRRISRPVLRARFVIEAGAGAARTWGVRPGDVVTVEAGRRDA
jgi:uncharacterized membrane protein (UPF0127 family)